MSDSTILAKSVGAAPALREHYPEPSEPARKKTLARLDQYCRQFIALSPFLCLGTGGDGGLDVSPRGDPPGFVHVLDDTTLLIPDRPGNNRLDSLSNVVASAQVGLLFMIPGVNETLRVNGTARVTTDPALLAPLEINGKVPASALVVDVREAFLHCAKALVRSKLWGEEYKVDRRTLPSLGKMLADQLKSGLTAEAVDAYVEKDYATRLY